MVLTGQTSGFLINEVVRGLMDMLDIKATILCLNTLAGFWSLLRSGMSPYRGSLRKVTNLFGIF
jgi:hypothetical protein